MRRNMCCGCWSIIFAVKDWIKRVMEDKDMATTIKKDTIHAGGIDIGIYTTDFKK